MINFRLGTDSVSLLRDQLDDRSYVMVWHGERAAGHFFTGKKNTDEQLERAIVGSVRGYFSHHYPNIELPDQVRGLEFIQPLPFVNGHFAQNASVVICTRNRSKELQACLRSMQLFQIRPAEIIVVDNGSSGNDTQQVVQNFPDVVYVREDRAGLDIARNTGIRHAKGEFIVFADDDTIQHPHWLPQILAPFEDKAVHAVAGLVITNELLTQAQFLFEQNWSFNRGYVPVVYDHAYLQANAGTGAPVWKIGAGANMAFRKSAFERCGVFHEHLDAGAAGCNGDSEMWFRILKNGGAVVYNPAAIVFHTHRKTITELRSQIRFYMRGFVTAALIQRRLDPHQRYLHHLLVTLPMYYAKRTARGFPRYLGKNLTLFHEITGFLSGFYYYLKLRFKK